MSEHWPHWLIFNDERQVIGCHCGFKAELDSDCGWGDSVVEHLRSVAWMEGHAAGQRGSQHSCADTAYKYGTDCPCREAS